MWSREEPASTAGVPPPPLLLTMQRFPHGDDILDEPTNLTNPPSANSRSLHSRAANPNEGNSSSSHSLCGVTPTREEVGSPVQHVVSNSVRDAMPEGIHGVTVRSVLHHHEEVEEGEKEDTLPQSPAYSGTVRATGLMAGVVVEVKPEQGSPMRGGPPAAQQPHPPCVPPPTSPCSLEEDREVTPGESILLAPSRQHFNRSPAPSSARETPRQTAPSAISEGAEDDSSAAFDAEAVEMEVRSRKFYVSAVAVPVDPRAMDSCAICRVGLADPPLGHQQRHDFHAKAQPQWIATTGVAAPASPALHSSGTSSARWQPSSVLAGTAGHQTLTTALYTASPFSAPPPMTSGAGQTSTRWDALRVLAAREEEVLVSTGACGHTFHTHCVEEWRETKATCPLCDAVWVEPEPPVSLE